MEKKIPVWLSGGVVFAAFGLLLWREISRPLRRSVEPKIRRNARNLAVAALAAVTVQIAEQPIAALLAVLVEQRGWGLLKLCTLPTWLEVPLAILLMDYTLYIWHVLTHRVPWLWRFHIVHHADLDLDASTALRFHFGELVLSVPWRIAQITLFGVSPLSLSIWQTALMASIIFHHSNARLPIEVERVLSRFIVTPRMHGIHHSVIQEETNSNWSSGLTLWDWLHGTLRLNVPQDEITIGVPAYRSPDEVALPKIISIPFRRQPPIWQLPEDGQPARQSSRMASDRLLP